jgi:thiamine-monophosphate kinase
MGGEPAFALVSLALPPALPVNAVEDLYAGVVAEAGAFGVKVVGGNVTATPGPMAIDVTLLGFVPRNELLRRSGALVGDVLAVTGSLGARAALWRLFEGGLDPRAIDGGRLWDQRLPVARVEAGRIMATSGAVHALIDISDGLSSDAVHLCQASDVGAVIDSRRLPHAVGVDATARVLGLDPVQLALHGGEDYELLCALRADSAEDLQSCLSGIGLTVIGEVRPREEGMLVLDAEGKRAPLVAAGWRHF